MNKAGTKHPGKASSAGTIVDSRVRNRKARLIQATDRVYCANAYSVSNALYVITKKSVVVIDTTESISAARASLADFRKITELPVSWIVYTHFHGDHIRGAKAFHGPGVKIIAQRRMPEDLARNNMLLPYRERVNAIQLGTPLPAGNGTSVLNDPEDGYMPPDTLFDEEFRFEEGGTQFELYHTQGESTDHLMVWMPRKNPVSRRPFLSLFSDAEQPVESRPPRGEMDRVARANAGAAARMPHPFARCAGARGGGDR